MIKKAVIAIILLLALGASLYIMRKSTHQSQNRTSIERGISTLQGEGNSHIRDANRRPAQPPVTGQRQR